MALTNPTGRITSTSPEGGNFGIDWEKTTRYDPQITAEADPVGWPAERIRATIAIESRGDPTAVQQNDSNGWSYGLMQVVPYGVGWGGWHTLVKEQAKRLTGRTPATRAGVVEALYDPAVNIACGVAILESFYVQHGTLDQAQSAFFLGNPNWSGGDTVNQNTGKAYQKSLNDLLLEQRSFLPPDPLHVIMGRVYSYDYGFKSPAAGPYYEYFNGHGGNAGQHTGIDIGGSRGEVLYTPLSGTVVCVGSNNGPGCWGTGCGAFPDKDGGGAGRIEIALDTGQSLILGHCASSLVSLGQAVVPGTPVATMGGMNGPHVHVETRIWREDVGDYWITDPVQTLTPLMRGVTTPGPSPLPYPERLPIPQPGTFDEVWEVRVLADELPVLQHTGSDAPEVAPKLTKGETFEATYLVYGQDGNPWWISKAGGRVPLAGTKSDVFVTDGGDVPVDHLDAFLEDLAELIEKYDVG